MPEFLQLPWVIQVTFVSGYLGYTLGFRGRRERHTGTDIFMLTLSFGLVGCSFFLIVSSIAVRFELEGIFISKVIPALFSLSGSAIAGIYWHSCGWKKVFRFLHNKGLSVEDGSPTAWRSILDRHDESAKSQLFVELTNGKTYRCDDLKKFMDLPYGPCLLGPDGSVAMYVDTVEKVDGELVERDNILDENWGNLLTVIPAAQVANIELRLIA